MLLQTARRFCPRGLAARRPVCEKHLTQTIAVLAVTSYSCSLTPRGPTFNFPNHSLPHVYRMSLRHCSPPKAQKRINADRLSYLSPHENSLILGRPLVRGGDQSHRPPNKIQSKGCDHIRVRSAVGIVKESESARRGCNLLEDLQPFQAIGNGPALAQERRTREFVRGATQKKDFLSWRIRISHAGGSRAIFTAIRGV